MERLTEVYVTTTGVNFVPLWAARRFASTVGQDESGCRCDKVGEMQIRLAAYEDNPAPHRAMRCRCRPHARARAGACGGVDPD